MPIPAPAALHHTCFLVRDLEGTAQRLADSLGIAAFEVRTIVPAWSRVHGKECPFTFRVALGMVGGAALSSSPRTPARASTTSTSRHTARASTTPASSTRRSARCAKPRPA